MIEDHKWMEVMAAVPPQQHGQPIHGDGGDSSACRQRHWHPWIQLLGGKIYVMMF
jgi:hypothetical protein